MCIWLSDHAWTKRRLKKSMNKGRVGYICFSVNVMYKNAIICTSQHYKKNPSWVKCCVKNWNYENRKAHKLCLCNNYEWGGSNEFNTNERGK